MTPEEHVDSDKTQALIRLLEFQPRRLEQLELALSSISSQRISSSD